MIHQPHKCMTGLFLVLSLILTGSGLPANSEGGTQAPITLRGGVDMTASGFDVAGLRLDSAKLPAVVETVAPGSPAFRAGVVRLDRVVAAALNGTTLNITIERAGKRYLVPIVETPMKPSLDPQAFRLPRQGKVTDQRLQGNIADQLLEGNVTDQRLQRGIPRTALRDLAKYDLELIVDHSLSMRRQDCPGGLSRWNWCGQQAAQMASALSGSSVTGLTITPFARTYHVYERSTPQNVVDIFERTPPELGTRLAEPLQNRLQNYFMRHETKPLLIAVITDGVPQPPIERVWVQDVLVEATRYMRDPRQVTVVFLQIGGEDRRGRRYLSGLQSDLVYQGARYPIVQTRSFEQVEARGLGLALVDAVHSYGAPGY